MKALVTGGAGFIGSHLTQRLVEQGYAVTVIDNLKTGRLKNIQPWLSQINFIEADISKPDAWCDAFTGIDHVYHLAAMADIVPSVQDPTVYFHSNVDGTFNVVQAAKQANCKRFVYSASSSCYGIPDVYPTSETAVAQPQYPYALTKYLGEQIVMHWAKVYKLPAVSLRLFNVYGPRSRTNGTYGAMFGVFLAQLLANKPLTIVGDGKQTRDFIYVTDVADAFMAAANSNCSNQIFNVGCNNPVSVNRIVELLGVNEINYIPKRPGEPDCTHANIDKICSQLRWSPKVSIEQGVRLMLDEIDYWREAPVWTPETIAVETRDWFSLLKD